MSPINGSAHTPTNRSALSEIIGKAITLSKRACILGTCLMATSLLFTGCGESTKSTTPLPVQRDLSPPTWLQGLWMGKDFIGDTIKIQVTSTAITKQNTNNSVDFKSILKGGSNREVEDKLITIFGTEFESAGYEVTDTLLPNPLIPVPVTTTWTFKNVKDQLAIVMCDDNSGSPPLCTNTLSKQ